LETSEYGLGEAEHVEGAELEFEDLSMDAAANRIMAGHDPVPTEDPLLKAADERIWTYVFAFDGPKLDTLREHARTNGWPAGKGPDCMCVLGRAFGASTDSPIRTQRAPTAAGELFLIDETEEPLGWWLGHLVWGLGRRFRRPVLRPYFPANRG
jgi:hypothetical protein